MCFVILSTVVIIVMVVCYRRGRRRRREVSKKESWWVHVYHRNSLDHIYYVQFVFICTNYLKVAWFWQKVLWNWHNQNASVVFLIENIFAMFLDAFCKIQLEFLLVPIVLHYFSIFPLFEWGRLNEWRTEFTFHYIPCLPHNKYKLGGLSHLYN